MEWETMLVDEAPDVETTVVEHDESTRQEQALRAALQVLTEREKRVFEAWRLRGPPPTLEELGREWSISSERVRQMETSAFAKVRRAPGGICDGEKLAASRLPCAYQILARGRVWFGEAFDEASVVISLRSRSAWFAAPRVKKR